MNPKLKVNHKMSLKNLFVGPNISIVISMKHRKTYFFYVHRIKIKEVTEASCSAAWERERALKTEKTFILDAVRALQDVCMTYIFP